MTKEESEYVPFDINSYREFWTGSEMITFKSKDLPLNLLSNEYQDILLHWGFPTQCSPLLFFGNFTAHAKLIAGDKVVFSFAFFDDEKHAPIVIWEDSKLFLLDEGRSIFVNDNISEFLLCVIIFNSWSGKLPLSKIATEDGCVELFCLLRDVSPDCVNKEAFWMKYIIAFELELSQAEKNNCKSN